MRQHVMSQILLEVAAGKFCFYMLPSGPLHDIWYLYICLFKLHTFTVFPFIPQQRCPQMMGSLPFRCARNLHIALLSLIIVCFLACLTCSQKITIHLQPSQIIHPNPSPIEPSDFRRSDPQEAMEGFRQVESSQEKCGGETHGFDRWWKQHAGFETENLSPKTQCFENCQKES